MIYSIRITFIKFYMSFISYCIFYNFSNINVNIGLFLYPRNQAVNNNETFNLEVVTYNYKDTALPVGKPDQASDSI